MKVLLINHFPLEGSGSGTYTRDVAHFLLKGGHDVCIIFPENKEPAPVEGMRYRPVYFTGNTEAIAGAASGATASTVTSALPFNYPCFTTHPRSTTTFADLDEQQLAAYFTAFEQEIARAIEDFAPDIIHVQHIWLLSYLASKHDLPFIITAHGTDLMGYEKWPEFRVYANEAASACNRVITISKDNCKATVDTFAQIKEKTVLLSNGYNNDIFYPEALDRAALLATYGVPYNGEKFVLFAGKLAHFKGVDVLLHAVKKYEGLQPDAFVTVIAGTGQEDENLRRLAKELDLKSVFFIGHQSQAQLRSLYSTADVFVTPSRYEPFGLVALEAMACGLPVVATNKGGLSDFVTSEVGSVTNCDPDDICAAILSEMETNERLPGRRALVAEYALQRFSMTHYIEELDNIYQEVLAK
ncbi:MAG: glycosyltransferase family 4 protein [Coriobacteriia bacterium]|nr:glycosyltransferase family 4 protein [Coriobacteriia bacterium]